MTSFKIKDFIHETLITVSNTWTIQQAAKYLKEHKLQCAPVVSDENKLIGIFKEEDLLDAAMKGIAPTELVELIADKQVFYLKDNESVNRIFATKERYPVVNDQEQLIGIFDINSLAQKLKDRVEDFHLQTGPDLQKTELLETIMEFAYDGIVMVDTEGIITMVNKEYADFLGRPTDEIIGKHCTEVIDNTRMHIVAQTGKAEVADLQKINGDYMIATRIPIIKNNKVTGAVGKVLYKNVTGFHALHKRIKLIEKELKQYKGEFKELNKAKYSFDHLVGQSSEMIKAKQLAQKGASTDSNVLLLGESGTGKELFAHAIHNASTRAFGSFVKVNCAAIPADLLESELFGYEEGSFTGAKKGGKKGKFEAADGGTIFLDEIGELPLHMQVKFLRVLQEREVEKIGGTASKAIDVKIIAATNRNLEEMVEKGEFRLDLYYRLNVVTIHIPSLKQRDRDIDLLTTFLIDKLSVRLGKKINGITGEARRALFTYQWPGNIRELENVLERAINIADHYGMIDLEHLPEKITGVTEVTQIKSLEEVIYTAEKQALLDSLAVCKGNKSKAAKLLNISRTTFYEKASKHNITV